MRYKGQIQWIGAHTPITREAVAVLQAAEGILTFDCEYNGTHYPALKVIKQPPPKEWLKEGEPPERWKGGSPTGQFPVVEVEVMEVAYKEQQIIFSGYWMEPGHTWGRDAVVLTLDPDPNYVDN